MFSGTGRQMSMYSVLAPDSKSRGSGFNSWQPHKIYVHFSALRFSQPVKLVTYDNILR